MAVTRVKICCIRSHAEAALAVQYGASAIGLLPVMPGVPDGLSEACIAAIASRIPPGVASFVLTTHQDVASIIALQQRCHAHVVQICDCLTQGTYQELRAALPGVHLVQVIHVTGEDALRGRSLFGRADQWQARRRAAPGVLCGHQRRKYLMRV